MIVILTASSKGKTRSCGSKFDDSSEHQKKSPAIMQTTIASNASLAPIIITLRHAFRGAVGPCNCECLCKTCQTKGGGGFAPGAFGESRRKKEENDVEKGEEFGSSELVNMSF